MALTKITGEGAGNIDKLGIGTASPNSHLTTQTSSTSTSAFDFGVQVNNSFASNDSIAAIGFHNRADVNATGVGSAIAFVGGRFAFNVGPHLRPRPTPSPAAIILKQRICRITSGGATPHPQKMPRRQNHPACIRCISFIYVIYMSILHINFTIINFIRILNICREKASYS